MRCHCGIISRVYVPLAISDANLILSTYGQRSRRFPGRTSSRGKTGSTKTSRGCSKPMAFRTSTSYPRPLCFLPSTRNSAVSGHPSVQPALGVCLAVDINDINKKDVFDSLLGFHNTTLSLSSCTSQAPSAKTRARGSSSLWRPPGAEASTWSAM